MTFEQFLATTKADAAVIHRAVRLHISHVTGDLTPDAMRDQLRAAVDDPALLEEGIGHLAADSASVEQAALAYFGELWTEEQQQPSIVASFAQARRTRQGNGRTPVVETAIIAAYASYLGAIQGTIEAFRARPNDANLDVCTERAHTG